MGQSQKPMTTFFKCFLGHKSFLAAVPQVAAGKNASPVSTSYNTSMAWCLEADLSLIMGPMVE